MIDVEVRNFQSIEQATLKVEGFTALVGRSNIGKSAIVRAVKAALTGAPVSSFVRHGRACLRRTKKAKTCKCFSAVHLKAEGFDMLWEKGDAINRYTFNGVVYDKAEKGTPEFLLPAFLPVKIADKQEMLQVADQFSAIFLLDQTGGVVADVLSDVARLDRINVAMRMAERDRKEAVSTRKVREKDAAELQVRLDDFVGLDVAVHDVAAVQAELDEIEKKAEKAEKLDEFMASGAALGQRIRTLEMGLLVEVPDHTQLATSSAALLQLDGWRHRYAGQMAAIEVLLPVETLAIPERGPIQTTHETYTKLSRWHGQLVDFRDFFALMKPIEVLPVLDATGVKDGLVGFQQVHGYLTRLEALEATLAKLEAAYAAILVEEKEAHDEMEALGVCPTCVRPLGTP
jgi:hypothetical protein